MEASRFVLNTGGNASRAISPREISKCPQLSPRPGFHRNRFGKVAGLLLFLVGSAPFPAAAAPEAGAASPWSWLKPDLVHRLPAPPFEAHTAEYPGSEPAAGSRIYPRLAQIDAIPNQITDEEAWHERNEIPAQFLDLPTPFRQTAGELPETVPARLENNWPAVRAFRDRSAAFVVYGEDFSAGSLLTIWTPDFSSKLGALDFAAYRRAPRAVAGDEAFVDQAIRYARIVDGVLYVSHAHRTYAKSSHGMNAYIAAIDLGSGQLLWRSAPLVANCANFVAIDDAIVSGYGFTAEDDYLFVLDRHTGKTVSRIRVKTAPEMIFRKGNILHVRTYNTDYQFRLD